MVTAPRRYVTEFRSSERRCRLLKYLAEKAAAGEGVKEYSIGVDVFDKPADYDPRLDPVVRVEMGRVRAKLADYYAGDGRANPDRLEFPKRSYVPTLRPAAPQGANIATPATRPRRLWPAAALVAALCATAALPGVSLPTPRAPI